MAVKRASCGPVGPRTASLVLTLVCCRLVLRSAVMASAGGARRVEPLGILARGLQLHAGQFELAGLLEDSLKWDKWRH